MMNTMPDTNSPTVPHLRDLIDQPQRRAAMQARACGIALEACHQRLDLAGWQALFNDPRLTRVATLRASMLRGEAINTSENRAVLHMALRAPEHAAWAQWQHSDSSIAASVQRERQRMLDFAMQVRSGRLRGAQGRVLRHVVNIGIGGSDLGPRMAQHALRHWAAPDHAALAAASGLGVPEVKVHYVSNPDACELYDTLLQCEAHSTLFIFASKTLTTQETCRNVVSAQRWLQDAGVPQAALAAHWAVVTAQPERALAAGFAPERTFSFAQWVGGRYSLWSALGLPLAIAIGADGFNALLRGAAAMDAHFVSAPWAENLPVILALCGAYNRQQLAAATQLIACYSAHLRYFVPYVQQLDMESNGKQVQRDGRPCTQLTGPILWGGLGIDGQHAYFQLLHQGMHVVPVEFIGLRQDATPLPEAAAHLKMVQDNLQAQARALAVGRVAADYGLPSYKNYPGNIPSSTLWLEQLDPQHLGALIALYEHKVFVQGALWNINSFDQWGVELGKEMVQTLA